MKIQVAAGQLWVFEDDHRPLPRNAAAGPFRDRNQAAWWMVERVEKGLRPEEVPQWGRALALAGGVDANPFQLLGLLTLIRRKASQGLIDRSSPAVRERGQILHERAPEYPVTGTAPRESVPDYKLVAAGAA